MKLQDAISSIIEQNGTGMLSNVLVLNILNDYNAFDDVTSAKNVLKNLITEGFIERIIFAHDNHLDMKTLSQKCLNELYEKYGFRKDTLIYVINSIIGALGYELLNAPTDEAPAPTNNKQAAPTFTKTGNHLSFRDIEINGTISDFCAQLIALGYHSPVTIDGGSMVLKGDFAGVPNCEIYVIRSRYDDFVWKVAVFMPENNNWYGLKSEYERFKNMFTKKYGTPKSYEFFSDPYEEGDGYELTALSVGKCSYISFYHLPLGVISVSISDSGSISIGYEDEFNTERKSSEIDNLASDEI